jgi:hypothetical protein
MTSITDLSPKALRRAADIQERIGSLQDELKAILGSFSEAPAAQKPAKRRMSAAGRARIAAGAKARWAKIKAEALTRWSPTRTRRRGMSVAGRARMAAAARERWRKAKAAGKTTL